MKLDALVVCLLGVSFTFPAQQAPAPSGNPKPAPSDPRLAQLSPAQRAQL